AVSIPDLNRIMDARGKPAHDEREVDGEFWIPACRNEWKMVCRRYSTFSPSFFTSPPHFFSSLSISEAYSAGVEVIGSPPSAWMRLRTSSVLTILRNSALSLSTMSFGVPDGAHTA